MRKIIFGLLVAFASPVFAESYIKACGVLSYEETEKYGSDELVYAVYTEFYRFEIPYLKGEQIDKLEKLRTRSLDGKIMGACVKGYFGGDFSWTGFATGEVELTRLKIYSDKESVYSFYKNYDR